ncbi:MAG TPA: N,N-dimethylformamidase beta subunit family domain-containing protein, partial [Anaerolineales bacterium]|nr:N,N-dimethylformamidase beta subunit family domain-containing protein [Anaerolineales bacterium]
MVPGPWGRLVQQIGPLDGLQQPECPTDATTGMISCEWGPSYTFHVPDTWTSGIYLAILTNAEKYQNYIVFVVRDDKRVADFIYQQPVTTYQAYNNYPSDEVTGKSLYNHNSFGDDTIADAPRAVQVSF